MPYMGRSNTGFGIRDKFQFTAAGSETTVSGSDDNSRTLKFSDGKYVDVYLNGVLLSANTDYNTTTTNTIGGLVALAANDLMEIVSYDIFSVADVVPATGGTFSGNVAFVGDTSIGGNQTVTGDLTVTGNLIGDIEITGTTPKLTIGDAGTEDSTLLFDGNAQDYYVALDDSADDLVIGLGATVGTTPAISINSDQLVTTFGDITMTGTTPTLTIGDAGAEDASIVFDGNAQDFYIALDDSADDLVIGLGATIGTTPAISIDENQLVTTHAGITLAGATPTLTIGDAGAEDTKIVFDGNAQDFYMGLDDSADDLIIGLGSAVGTTPAISITEALKTQFGGAAVAKTITDATNTGNVTLDYDAGQNFVLTFTGNVTLVNPSTESVGQTGIIVIIQDGTGSRTLSVGTDYEFPAGTAPTISTGANTTDIIPYCVIAANRVALGAPQLAFA
jgi:hypothetical protein